MYKTKKLYFPTKYALLFTLPLIAVGVFACFFMVLKDAYNIFGLLGYAAKTVTGLAVISSKLSSKAKLSWLFLTLVFPYAAIPAYLIFCPSRLSKKEKIIIDEIKSKAPKSEHFNTKIELKCNEDFAFLKEISNFSNFKIYKNTLATHIDNAKKMKELLLDDIKRARRFIFLEFYTVSSGDFFGEICEELIKKAAEGVEVRIIYDELGSLFRIPEEFTLAMKEKNIRALSQASLTGIFPSGINNRNHRKIAIIDGEIAYTGGINLADEYIDPPKRLKEWKDSAARLEGEAVDELTYTFLADYVLISGETEDFSPYYKYKRKRCEGAMIPFSDGPSPIYSRRISKMIILSLISGAERELIISTPYLVCDGDVLYALENAVRRGVKIGIVIPSRADRVLAGILTKTYAQRLIEAGVAVYEYTPGFIHSKLYMADGRYLLTGTVNLDCRSLDHNFENGILFLSHPVINEVAVDLRKIFESSKLIERRKTPLFKMLLGAFIEVFAPLF